MSYQVWDDETGNVVASFDSLTDAVTLLHGMLAQNGPSSVRELAVIQYPSDGSDPTTVLEGEDFLAQKRVKA